MSYKSNVVYQIETPIFNDSTSTHAQNITYSSKGCGIIQSAGDAAVSKTVSQYANAVMMNNKLDVSTQHFMKNVCISKNTGLITDKSGDSCTNNSVIDLSKISKDYICCSALIKCSTNLSVDTNSYYVMVQFRGLASGATDCSTEYFRGMPRQLNSSCRIINLVDDIYELRFGYYNITSLAQLYSTRLGLIHVSNNTGSNVAFTLQDLAIGFNLA